MTRIRFRSKILCFMLLKRNIAKLTTRGILILKGCFTYFRIFKPIPKLIGITLLFVKLRRIKIPFWFKKYTSKIIYFNIYYSSWKNTTILLLFPHNIMRFINRTRTDDKCPEIRPPSWRWSFHWTNWYSQYRPGKIKYGKMQSLLLISLHILLTFTRSLL